MVKNVNNVILCNRIKELIQSFSEAELTSLFLKTEDFELNLGKEKAIYQTVMTGAPIQTQPTLQSDIQSNGGMINEPIAPALVSIKASLSAGIKDDPSTASTFLAISSLAAPKATLKP